MTKIRELPTNGGARVETGPLRFGHDWPGAFIRGGDAGYYAKTLQALLDGREHAFTRSVVRQLIAELTACRLGPDGKTLPLVHVEPTHDLELI
jgi:hypothetical protein